MNDKQTYAKALLEINTHLDALISTCITEAGRNDPTVLGNAVNRKNVILEKINGLVSVHSEAVANKNTTKR